MYKFSVFLLITTSILVTSLCADDSTLNLDYCDSFGCNALMFAARRGNHTEVKQLLEHSTKLDMINCLGETALSYALKGNHLTIAALLLDAGAEPDQIAGSIGSPPVIALNENNFKAYRLLISRGIFLDATIKSETLSSELRTIYDEFMDDPNIIAAAETYTSTFIALLQDSYNVPFDLIRLIAHDFVGISTPIQPGNVPPLS